MQGRLFPEYFSISVALYDIDQDGIRELLISHGTCLADWVNDIYTLEDRKICELYWKCRQTGTYFIQPQMEMECIFCMDIKDIRR